MRGKTARKLVRALLCAALVLVPLGNVLAQNVPPASTICMIDPVACEIPVTTTCLALPVALMTSPDDGTIGKLKRATPESAPSFSANLNAKVDPACAGRTVDKVEFYVSGPNGALPPLVSTALNSGVVDFSEQWNTGVAGDYSIYVKGFATNVDGTPVVTAESPRIKVVVLPEGIGDYVYTNYIPDLEVKVVRNDDPDKFAGDGETVAVAEDGTIRIDTVAFDLGDLNAEGKLVTGAIEDIRLWTCKTLCYSLDSSKLLTTEFTRGQSLLNEETGEDDAEVVGGVGLDSSALLEQSNQIVNGSGTGNGILEPVLIEKVRGTYTWKPAYNGKHEVVAVARDRSVDRGYRTIRMIINVTDVNTTTNPPGDVLNYGIGNHTY